jgi:hypothetical protein
VRAHYKKLEDAVVEGLSTIDVKFDALADEGVGNVLNQTQLKTIFKSPPPPGPVVATSDFIRATAVRVVPESTDHWQGYMAAMGYYAYKEVDSAILDGDIIRIRMEENMEQLVSPKRFGVLQVHSKRAMNPNLTFLAFVETKKPPTAQGFEAFKEDIYRVSPSMCNGLNRFLDDARAFTRIVKDDSGIKTSWPPRFDIPVPFNIHKYDFTALNKTLEEWYSTLPEMGVIAPPPERLQIKYDYVRRSITEMEETFEDSIKELESIEIVKKRKQDEIKAADKELEIICNKLSSLRETIRIKKREVDELEHEIIVTDNRHRGLEAIIESLAARPP